MIGIFDSGIGGITVLNEILKILRNYNYVYYSDSLNNPYGDKEQKELETITKDIVERLINKGCKIIVIACNTASAICKDYLRSIFDIPIIAIEPAIKQVKDANIEGNILVMATNGTIHSEKFLELSHKFQDKNMIIEAFPGLADLIEQDKKEEIKYYLNEHLKYNNIKTVVLGCTHYPLIKNEIKEVLGDVTFVDGSVGVANRLKQVVQDIDLKETGFNLEFIDSANSDVNKNRFYELLKR